MHWMSPFFYMEAKFGPIEKGIKTTDINRDEVGYNIFDNKRNEEIL